MSVFDRIWYNPSDLYIERDDLSLTFYKKVFINENWIYLKKPKLKEISNKDVFFSSEFREFLIDYLLLNNSEIKVKRKIEEMVWHLDNIEDYLYKLI